MRTRKKTYVVHPLSTNLIFAKTVNIITLKMY